MNLNFWPKMYGYGGGGGSGGGGGGAGGSGGSGGAGGGYGGGAGAGGGVGTGGGAAGEHSPKEPTPAGALRFNTDSSKLEYYDGNQWVNVTTDSPEQHTGGTRGVTAGINENPQWQEHMDFFNIATTGNSTDFGDLSADIFAVGTTASSTRGLVFGGYGGSPHSANSDEIQFVTIASQGNATDFGNLTVGRSNPCVSGSQTRAVAAGGGQPTQNVDTIDYVTIASQGNAVDFGDCTAANNNSSDGGCGNATRGLFHTRTPNNTGAYFHYNIATTGNATEFSDEVNSGNNTLAGGSNAVRGLFQGAYNGNAITAVTILTLGSAFDFGDQTTTRYTAGAAASGTRYVTIAGQGFAPAAGMTNVMEYVQIMTTGNTIDFGDLSRTGYYVSGMSNGHGGLG
tara:strand:- start:260 stop:1450 length:1191 start_codon:yes stop_codon:yes gene_type:complete